MAGLRYPSDMEAMLRLRTPHDLRGKLKALAKQNKRSMTAEIVARLEASLEFPGFVDCQTDGEALMSEEQYPSQQEVRLMLRSPPELHAQLKEGAALNNRSLTKEVVARLEASGTQQGIGLREYLAGQALNGLLASHREASREDIAGEARSMADATIAALAANGEPQ